MTTPLGGPSQLLVKCRNNQGSGGQNIRTGDAVQLDGHVFDTSTGEPILLVSPFTPDGGEGSRARFLGIAMSSAAKGTGASGTGAYLHVCVFGMCQARVSAVGAHAVAAGEAVFAGGASVAYDDGGSGRGVLADDAGASGASGVPVGNALEAGKWGSTGATQVLTWVFLNGIGRHAFGGS